MPWRRVVGAESDSLINLIDSLAKCFSVYISEAKSFGK
ncbi:unnamed protein product [Acidithrix sp. C25]|nr:unnamed protein product [Acidithrix sp. C25]